MWNEAAGFTGRTFAQQYPIAVGACVEHRAAQAPDKTEQYDENHRDHAEAEHAHDRGAAAFEQASQVVTDRNHLAGNLPFGPNPNQQTVRKRFTRSSIHRSVASILPPPRIFKVFDAVI